MYTFYIEQYIYKIIKVIKMYLFTYLCLTHFQTDTTFERKKYIYLYIKKISVFVCMYIIYIYIYIYVCVCVCVCIIFFFKKFFFFTLQACIPCNNNINKCAFISLR